MAEQIIPDLKATSRKLSGSTPIDVSIVDGAGAQVTSFGGTGGTSSSFGAAFPASGTAAGFKDSTGTNMAAGNLDASGNLLVAGSLSTTPPAAATSALTNVPDNVVSVTLLASNANRKAFMLYNDSDSSCYVKFGATASATSFVKKMLPRERFTTMDVGVNYTGRIDGIWDSAPGGNMRVTELTT